MSAEPFKQHIELRPGVTGAKPCIVGHRISVHDIAVWHEKMGKSVDEIAAECDLGLADIYAALAYYFDHRAEIDRQIEESDAFAQALRKRTPSRLMQRLHER